VEFHTFGVRFNAQEVPVQLVGHECLGQDRISAKGDSWLNGAGECKGGSTEQCPSFYWALPAFKAQRCGCPNPVDFQRALLVRNLGQEFCLKTCGLFLCETQVSFGADTVLGTCLAAHPSGAQQPHAALGGMSPSLLKTLVGLQQRILSSVWLRRQNSKGCQNGV